MTAAALQLRRVGEIDVAVLTGEVDIAAAPELRAAIAGRIGTARALVVDASRVTYLDSGGIRMLDGVAGRCRELGVPLAVVAPSGRPARTVLDICGFPPSLLVETTVEALGAVQRG